MYIMCQACKQRVHGQTLHQLILPLAVSGVFCFVSGGCMEVRGLLPGDHAADNVVAEHPDSAHRQQRRHPTGRLLLPHRPVVPHLHTPLLLRFAPSFPLIHRTTPQSYSHP